ncbi:uncharacterized protein LOC126661787 [Mercurialis annua]|uniref:uncharacterized protein LOC126661787 n=1 Tax=Mercurialis annua TaxID=3986 RepID=UPI00215FD84E|nr:uncharacterized protein LOC126661787 [Mercurialis annua]
MGKGVRQGDPLSLMLFVLAVEGLKALIVQAVRLNILDGVHVDGYPEPLSILQFADDTLIFVPNDLDMIKKLLRVLRCFEVISGLSINYQKISIVGINMDNDSLLSASSILNCSISHFPITYLGLPLSVKPIRATSWNPIVDNFQSQLANWKGNLLSPADFFGVVCQKEKAFIKCRGISIPAPLSTRFPRLFSLFSNPHISVSHMFSNMPIQFTWRRRLRIGEQEELELLLAELNLVTINSNVLDTYSWMGRPNSFNCRSVSRRLQQGHSVQNRLQRGALATGIWKWKVPPRIQFFAWFLVKDRLFSNASLVARGIINYDLIGCSICNEIETSIHIVLHCEFAWKFWSVILRNCDICWVSSPSIEDFYNFWSSLSIPVYKDLWWLVWFFGCWKFWKARNNRVFNDGASSTDSLVYLVICRAVLFYASFHPHFPYSGNDVFRCIDYFVKTI